MLEGTGVLSRRWRTDMAVRSAAEGHGHPEASGFQAVGLRVGGGRGWAQTRPCKSRRRRRSCRPLRPLGVVATVT